MASGVAEVVETSAALSDWNIYGTAMSDAMIALASLTVVTHSGETLGAMLSSFAGETGGDKALDVVLLSSTLAAS